MPSPFFFSLLLMLLGLGGDSPVLTCFPERHGKNDASGDFWVFTSHLWC